MKTSNYGSARGVLGFAELTLWGGIGLGIIVAFVAGSAAARGYGASGFLAAVPGILMAIVCFVGVVLVQMAKASVDTADYTYQLLKLSRDQLAVSKQALQVQKEAPTSYATAPNPIAPAAQASFAENGAATATDETAPDANGTSLPRFLRQDQADIHGQEHWDYRDKRIHHTEHGTYLIEGHTFETLDQAKEFVDDGPKVEFGYLGRRVRVFEDMYLFNGRTFKTKADAKRYLDGI